MEDEEIHHWPILYGLSVGALQNWWLQIWYLRTQSGEALLRDNFEKKIEEVEIDFLCCFSATMTERQTSIDGRLILSEHVLGLETWTIGAERAANYEPGCGLLLRCPTPESPGLAARLVDNAKVKTDTTLRRAANKLWWWKHRQTEDELRRTQAEQLIGEVWSRRQRARWSTPSSSHQRPDTA